jgi:bacillithiol synthase
MMDLSMESHCLPAASLPHTTRLFSAYLEDFAKVRSFYTHTPDLKGAQHAASEVRWVPEVRAEVLHVLREQNEAFGPGQATLQNLERLGAGAVAVVTGQQPGLFTGPAYSFYKALSAVRWAAILTENGTPAVPIFWLATEDHDLEEVDHCDWHGRAGIERLRVNPEGPSGRRIGEFSLGPSITATVERAAQSLEGPLASDVAEWLHEAYQPSADFGTAFARLMARALSPFGCIFLNPLDERLHALVTGLMREAIEQSGALTPLLIERGRELDSQNFHSQVRMTEQSTLFFVDVKGRREAVRRRGHSFHAANLAFTMAEAIARVERAPMDFSPNALFRPVVQDFLLPTAAYVAGPAEVAYFAQAERIYARLLGRMPAVLPRASFTLVEPRVARLLKKYRLAWDDILKGRQRMRTRMERECLPKDLGKRFRRGEKSLSRHLKNMRKPLEQLDPTLSGTLSTTERKMLYQYEKLREKTGRAANFRTGVLERDEQLLVDSLYTHRGMQERSLCLLPFLAFRGMDLLEYLVARAAGHSLQHQVVYL